MKAKEQMAEWSKELENDGHLPLILISAHTTSGKAALKTNEAIGTNEELLEMLENAAEAVRITKGIFNLCNQNHQCNHFQITIKQTAHETTIQRRKI